MPDVADAERREMPEGAKGGPVFTRTLALRAVGHSAVFGSPRCSAFAPFGIRAAWHLRRICALNSLRLFSFDYRQYQLRCIDPSWCTEFFALRHVVSS
jgi:hypothetical protein